MTARRRYAVAVTGIGIVHVTRANIRVAREWAAQAFGARAASVSRAAPRARCSSCDSRPCTCPEGRA